jgi:putative phosphonate metabolism protein
MGPDGRVALYYAPLPDDPLWTRGIDWLGSDPAGNALRAQPGLPDMQEVTADPRGYGFHATLKPPMRLVPGTGWQDVRAAAAEIAAGIAPFEMPPLAVRDLSGFLALCETTPSMALQALADACVVGLDALRAPPGEAELARRRHRGLSPAEEAMLTRWGYCHVFSTWQFHMTLTRRLTTEERDVYRPAAEAFFADALARPRRVQDICLFTQPAPGAAFTLAERIPLRG